jgi:hypothetical protein
MHRSTRQFWLRHAKLPPDAQRRADKCFALLKSNPSHPSLQFKRIGDVWSVRIDLFYRAVAVEDGADYIWVWIGPHGEYERILKRR